MNARQELGCSPKVFPSSLSDFKCKACLATRLLMKEDACKVEPDKSLGSTLHKLYRQQKTIVSYSCRAAVFTSD